MEEFDLSVSDISSIFSNTEENSTFGKIKLAALATIARMTLIIIFLESHPCDAILRDAMSIYLRHNLTIEAFLDILRLLQKFPDNTYDFPTTKYKLFQRFPGNLDVYCHVKCQSCGVFSEHLAKSEKYTCSQCRKILIRKQTEFFTCIKLKPQLENQIKKHWNHITKYADNQMAGHDTMKDVQDGLIFKRIHNLCIDGMPLPLMLNTDGANKFKSNRNSIWPILLVQNYLPPNLRYQRPNVILVAIHYGKKPDLKAYFKPLICELKSLFEKGLTIKLNDVNKTFKPYIMSICVDLPAKAMVLNQNQYNGYYSCGYCLHPGCSISNLCKTRKCVRYTQRSTADAERNEFETLRDMREAHISRVADFTKNGFKGLSCAVGFDHFDIVNGFSLDYMHCILLGVVSKTLDLWLNSKNKTQDFYLKPKQRDTMNRRLISLRPCSGGSRLPRSLNEYKNYKANEFRSWILFYMKICAEGIQKRKYVDHMQLLSASVYILLGNNITSQQLNIASQKCLTFVNEFEKIYGRTNMVMNVHLVLHLVNACKSLGPLWTQSAFVFEDFNGVLLKHAKGTTDVILQIASKYVLDKSYSEDVENRKFDNPVGLGRAKKQKIPANCDVNDVRYNEMKAYQDAGAVNFTNRKFVTTFDRIQLQNVTITSQNYTKAIKTIDYFVRLKCGTFGIVKYYLQEGDIIFAMLEIFQTSANIDQFYEVHTTEARIIVEAIQIDKRYCFFQLNGKSYIVASPNGYEKN